MIVHVHAKEIILGVFFSSSVDVYAGKRVNLAFLLVMVYTVFMLVKEIIHCVFFLFTSLVDMLQPGALSLYGVISLWDGGRVTVRSNSKDP
jgi:hypothetical protein